MNNVFHVTKDPVHGTMQFTSLENGWIKPFIDSPNFQRLRHIKQLGMGDYIFPGAVHSRFNHSLGCCYIASQIAHKIGLSDPDRQLVMIASLIHDIGHGPFSHAFEGMFHHPIRHEDWTPYFLDDFDPHFFAAYADRNPAFALNPSSFKQIADMIMHRAIEKTILCDIVSSQLDADRLDYLLRDSHFCGVRYGEYDLHWMLHCMTIVKYEQQSRLAVTHKGIGVVEHYLMARRLMMRNIYHSQKKLAIESLLVQFLKILAESIEQEPGFSAIRNTVLGTFLVAVATFNRTNGSPSEKEKFLKAQFNNYKLLCDDDVYTTIRSLARMQLDHPAIALAERLQSRKMPKIIRLDHLNLGLIQAELAAFKHQYRDDFADWQLIFIETPHQSYSGAEDPIMVVNEENELLPLSFYSVMINAIADQYEKMTFIAIDQVIINDARIQQFIHEIKSKR